MVAIYVRQSIEKKDSISIDDQINRCKNELNNSDDFIIYDDRGFSGKNTQRPKFIEMMNDIKMGKINKVIVYKIDRISRAIVDFGKIMTEFESKKIEFISCSEKFDTSTPIGKAMLNIIMVFAQLERETIQQRVTDNYYARGKIGFYLGGKPPFGFEKIETYVNGKKTYTLTPNKEKVEVINRLFEQYAYTNISTNQLAMKLNNENLTTDRNKHWSGTIIGRLLRHPAYVFADVDVYIYLKEKGAILNNSIDEFNGTRGCMIYGNRKEKTRHKLVDLTNEYITLGFHEGIIPSYLWLACQYKMDKNKQIKNSGKGTHSWLSGLMKCGYCGYAINAVNGQRNGKIYINCGGRKNGICYERKKTILISDIEAIVEKLLLNIFSTWKENKSELQPIDNSELNSLKINLLKIDDNINTLIDKLLNANEVTMEYINKKIVELDIKKKEIIKEMKSVTCAKIEQPKFPFDIKECCNNWSNYSFEQKKEIAKLIITKVIITDDIIMLKFDPKFELDNVYFNNS